MIKEVLVSENRIKEKVQEMGRAISRDYQGKEILMVVLLRGSFIFAADLIREIEPDVCVDFLKVSSYAGEESSGEVRILKDLDENIHGRDVLVVEDIVDTGLTLSKILEVLKSRNPKSLQICSLLDKPSRRIRPVEVKYLGFSIPDRFVVGYGLDVNQKYRQLKEVVVVENEIE